jgi:signal transduction histidine kinase
MNNLLDNFSDQYNLKETGGSIIREFVSDREIAIEIDPQLFKQAIFNLIKNGLEAGRPDCSVTVRWRELSLPETQQVFGHKLELSALEAVAKIEIEDNGAGIPERDLGKIFSPFYSTKQKGTGLGLSIAWKIVKAHGGDIKAESEVGHGTKFSIVLPMKAGG